MLLRCDLIKITSNVWETRKPFGRPLRLRSDEFPRTLVCFAYNYFVRCRSFAGVLLLLADLTRGRKIKVNPSAAKPVLWLTCNPIAQLISLLITRYLVLVAVQGIITDCQ